MILSSHSDASFPFGIVSSLCGGDVVRRANDLAAKEPRHLWSFN
jgi:hypothetical protein